jgi:hypothetical protein
MQSAVGEMIQNWLKDHPLLGWGVAHPFWALGGVVALLFMAGGLLKAIAQLTEQWWIGLLRLPMRTVRWGLARWFPWQKPQTDETISTQDSSSIGSYKQTFNQDHDGFQSSNQQLCEIMMRLERIQHEQTLLLRDIKTLLLNDQTLVIRKKQIVLNESSPKR